MACEASRPLRATARIALAPGHVADRVAAQGQSTPRCRRTPLPRRIRADRGRYRDRWTHAFARRPR